MKIDDSNKRYSMIIAGILSIYVLSIFMALTLDVGGKNIHTNYGNQPSGTGLPYMVYNNNTQDQLKRSKKDISGLNDVSLAESEPEIIMDTEVGEITVNWLLTDPLPLCITQTVLDELLWNGVVIQATTKGGYEPIGGTIDLYQGNCMWPWKENDLDDLEIVWSYDRHISCYYDVWNGTLQLPASVSSIELASNQWPAGASHPWWCGDKIPGKEVHLDIEILYQGCHEENQQFLLIMSHKVKSLESPTPDLIFKKFIAS
jgi:hypothetical protein